MRKTGRRYVPPPREQWTPNLRLEPGTHRLTRAEISRMWPAEIIPFWEHSFDYLVSTVVADAQGSVRPEVATLLRTPEWVPMWLDACNAAEGELLVAVERMRYTGDPRAQSQTELLREVRTEQTEARTRHRELLHIEGRAINAPNYQTATIAKSWLRQSRHAEADRIKQQILDERGLPTDHFGRDVSPEDRVEAIEIAAERGWIDYPVTPEIELLHDMTDVAFRNVVAQDAQDREHRKPELRHPLMLNDWLSALQDLAEMTESLALVSDGNLIMLTDTVLFSMEYEQAYKTFNARRFYAAVRQRMAEWERETTRLVRQVNAFLDVRRRPWTDAEAVVRDKLANLYPMEYEALLRMLDPFCDKPGGTQVHHRKFNNRVRGEVKAMALAALADGTWRNMLK